MIFAIIRSHFETSRHDTISELPALVSMDGELFDSRNFIS